MLSVGLEGKAALHRWIDGLQQVVADLELAEEMEQELLVAHRDAVAEAAVEAAAADTGAGVITAAATTATSM